MKDPKIQELIEIVKQLASQTPEIHRTQWTRDKNLQPWLTQSENDYRKDFKEIFEKENEGY